MGGGGGGKILKIEVLLLLMIVMVIVKTHVLFSKQSVVVDVPSHHEETFEVSSVIK